MRIFANRRSRVFRAGCAMVALLSLIMGPAGGFDLWAGGALLIGGPGLNALGLGLLEGKPILWDPTFPITYRIDGGPLSALADGTVIVDQPAGVIRVDSMFQVWGDVPTASITFSNAGALLNVGVFTDGNVDTAAEFNAVEGDCLAGNQSPIVFDADGTVFDELGRDPGVIGFAGACTVASSSGSLFISAARAVLNGKFIDGDNTNLELTPDGFDAAFIHEFGHLIGLDHTQINLECLTSNCSGSDKAFGIPTMFPFLLNNVLETTEAAQKTLAADDIAWVSALYPAASFATTYGTITGTIRFSDGISHAQGVNVIVRQVDDPATTGVDESARNAVSMVSGAWYTSNPGQSVSGTNPGGTIGGAGFDDVFIGSLTDPTLVGFYRISVLPGDYTVEVEAVNPGFNGGSGLRPFDPPNPMPGGVPEFYSGANESDTDDPKSAATDTQSVAVFAGSTVANIDIILNGTDPRFDQFESARLFPNLNRLPGTPPLWIREEDERLSASEEQA